MTSAVAACEAKLDRAREHRLALTAEIEQFFSSESLGYRVSFDEQQSAFLVHAILEHDRAYRWATIVGDVVHNLRSTLDHLVHQLVLLNKQEPAKSNQFPICDTLAAYEREIGKSRLAGVAARHQEHIRCVQPFRWAADYGGTTPARIEALARMQALAQLRDLSNRDKHQLLLPARLLAREFRWAVDFEHAVEVDTWTTSESIGHGNLLMSVRVRVTGPNPVWEPRLELGGYLALEATDLPAHEKPVIELLAMIEGATEQVLDLFRTDFESST